MHLDTAFLPAPFHKGVRTDPKDKRLSFLVSQQHQAPFAYVPTWFVSVAKLTYNSLLKTVPSQE